MSAPIAAEPLAHVLERRVVVAVGAEGVGVGQFSAASRPVEQVKVVERAASLAVKSDDAVRAGRKRVCLLNLQRDKGRDEPTVSKVSSLAVLCCFSIKLNFRLLVFLHTYKN